MTAAAQALPPSDYFELLGVDPLSSDVQIRRGFLERLRRLQEERAAAVRESRETQACDQSIGLLLSAYRTIGRGPSRLRYRRRQLEAQRPAEVPQAPVDAGELLARGLVTSQEGRLAEGAELLWRAAQVEFQSTPVLLAAGRAWTHLAAAQPEAGARAETLLKTAAASSPNDPEPLVELGLLYLQMRLWSTAAELLREALERDPLHPEAQRRLRWLESRDSGESASREPAPPRGPIGTLLQRLGLRPDRGERRSGLRDRRNPRNAAIRRQPDRRRRVRRLADLPRRSKENPPRREE